jgi:hypothetical protein
MRDTTGMADLCEDDSIFYVHCQQNTLDDVKECLLHI